MDKDRVFIIQNANKLTYQFKCTLSEEFSMAKVLINDITQPIVVDYIYLDDWEIIDNICKNNIKFHKSTKFLIPTDEIKKQLLLKGKNKLALNRFLMSYNTQKVLTQGKAANTQIIQIMQAIGSINRGFYFQEKLTEQEYDQLFTPLNAPMYFCQDPYILKSEKNLQSTYTYRDIKPILILGNDKNIKFLDVDKVKESNMITAGVNRIWKKFETDFLYFIDYDISKELYTQSPSLPNTKILKCEDYINGLLPLDAGERRKAYNGYKKFIENNYDVKDVRKENHTVNTVIWLISYLKNVLYKDEQCLFFVYGVSLKWDKDCHHFWEGDETVLNKANQNWYDPRFESHFRGFQKLQTKYKIISCTPDSRLNDLFPYQSIDSVLENFKRKEDDTDISI